MKELVAYIEENGPQKMDKLTGHFFFEWGIREILIASQIQTLARGEILAIDGNTIFTPEQYEEKGTTDEIENVGKEIQEAFTLELAEEFHAAFKEDMFSDEVFRLYPKLSTEWKKKWLSADYVAELDKRIEGKE